MRQLHRFAAGLPVMTALAMLSVTGVANAMHHEAAVTAHADILNGEGAKIGEARLTQEKAGIAVRISVSGLTPGMHGTHIHSMGTCDAPDFKGAGGHWNPGSMHHGLSNAQGHHDGDLPNLDVQPDGTGALNFIVAGAMITGGEMPLLDTDGAAIVIHAGPDDMVSDPAGNAGGRVACGEVHAG